MEKRNVTSTGVLTTQTYSRERLAFIFRLEDHPKYHEENAQRLKNVGFSDVRIEGSNIILTVPCLIDAHMHLREGSLQKAIIQTSIQNLVASIVMPNTSGKIE